MWCWACPWPARPWAAWIAVNGTLDPPAWCLALGVLTWTAGFDILYALQDLDFDRERRLHSIPSRLGVQRPCGSPGRLHLVALAAWAAFNLAMEAHVLPWLAWAAVAGILAREQWVVRGGRLERIDHAFFTLNSLVGLIFFAGLPGGMAAGPARCPEPEVCENALDMRPEPT